MSPTDKKAIAGAALLGFAIWLTRRPSYPKGTYPLPRTPLERAKDRLDSRKVEKLRKRLRK